MNTFCDECPYKEELGQRIELFQCKGLDVKKFNDVLNFAPPSSHKSKCCIKADLCVARTKLDYEIFQQGIKL